MRVHRERAELPVDDPWVDAVASELHRPSRPRGAALLLTHGAGSDLDAPWLVALADEVAAAGHLVLRVDQPWRTSGRAAPPATHLAVPGFAAVAEAARRVHGPRRSWVVGGHSNGGRIATHALAEHAVRATGGLLLGYPLCSIGKPDRPRVEHWDTIEVPLLVLQGTADRFGGPDDVAAHTGRLAAGATVHAVPGATHVFKVPRTRSADGATHHPAEVAAGLAPVVVDWLADR